MQELSVPEVPTTVLHGGAEELPPKRRLVRVTWDDESAWAEHVEGNVYRSLNHTFSNVLLKLPADHMYAFKNGQEVQLVWGHLFVGEPMKGRPGCVVPLYIIGEDMSPRHIPRENA